MTAFPFDVWLISFSFNYFFILNYFWFVFFNSFSLKRSNKFFTIKIINNISPWNCIFNFFNYKSLFWPISGISFSKNVFVFWNFYMITNLKFRTLFLRINIVFGIRIRFDINGLHFNRSMVCIIVFINNAI